MKTLQWAAAALAVGALALPSGAETVTTNDWWDVQFDVDGSGRTPAVTVDGHAYGGTTLRSGELGPITNNASLAGFNPEVLGNQPWASGYWEMTEGDESYWTNDWYVAEGDMPTFTNSYLKLDTQGNDLTWTPTNVGSVIQNVTTLVDADLYLVGSDSPPDAGDFDKNSDVQTAIYLKNELYSDDHPQAGETSNSVLCVYVYDGDALKNYWQELDGVELEDNAWAHVQVMVDHSGDTPAVRVFVNGIQMHARGSDVSEWEGANRGSESIKNRYKVSSVAFRGTGAVDNFVGKSVKETPFDFTAEVYINDVLQDSAAGGNATRVVSAFAGDGRSAAFKGFSIDDYWMPVEEEVTYAISRIVILDPATGVATATYNYTYDGDNITATADVDDSANVEFTLDENGELDGGFIVTASTAGATANATIVKIYFEDLPEEGEFKLKATQNVGTAPADQTFNVDDDPFPENATFTFADTLTSGGKNYVLSKIVPGAAPAVVEGASSAGEISVSYASPTVTVTVPLSTDIKEGSYNVATATYAEGTIAPGQSGRLEPDGEGGYDLVFSKPFAAIIVRNGETYGYETVSNAVEAVQDGETVVLVSTIANESVHYTGTAAFTIDLNGQTWNYLDGENGNWAAFKNDGATVTFKDSSEAGTGKIYCNGDGFCIWSRTGSVVIESGSFVNNSHEDYAIYIGTDDANFVGGVPPTITITGGSFVNEDNAPYNNKPAWSRLVLNVMNSNATARTLVKTELIQVSGGSYSWDPALGDDNMGGSFVAEGYKSVYNDATGLYNVVPDVNTVEITFMNGATTLYTTQIVENAAVAYVGETPEKEGTAQYSYTFAGWSTTDGGEALESLPDATANATYYAVFTESVNQYKVEWIVDGVRTTNEWAYNAMPSYGADDPTKDPTAATNFTFKAWDPAVVAVTGFASYTATWTETAREYAVTFKTNGVVYTTVQAEWNATDYAPAAPAAPDGKVFKGWAAEETPTTVLETLPAISGEATYVAVFDDDVIEPPEVDVGDNLLANDGAPMEFAADGKCTVRFRAPATGVYVLMSSTTVNGTYVADEAASATKTVTDLDDNLVELTEGTAGTTKFFKIGWSAE